MTIEEMFRPFLGNAKIKCIHGCWFPCQQCRANREHNEAATGKRLGEYEFLLAYTTAFDRGDMLDKHSKKIQNTKQN